MDVHSWNITERFFVLVIAIMLLVFITFFFSWTQPNTEHHSMIQQIYHDYFTVHGPKI